MRPAAFWLFGVPGDCSAYPDKSEEEHKDPDPYFLTLSHRSPRFPEQLASFFPGNWPDTTTRIRHRTRRARPVHPPPPFSRPPAAESPMGLVAARLENHTLSLPCPPSPAPAPLRPALALGSSSLSAALRQTGESPGATLRAPESWSSSACPPFPLSDAAG